MPVPETKGLGSPNLLNDFASPDELLHTRYEPARPGGVRGIGRRVDKTGSLEINAQLRKCLLGGAGTTHILGVGNPLRQDDSVGIEVVRLLKQRLRSKSSKLVTVHGVRRDSEREISKLASRGERMIIIDAVEAQKEPGSIVCAPLSETRYGFFATHNVPIRLVPNVPQNASNIYLVGIQPESVGVGEGLSESARSASDRLANMIIEIVEEAS